MLKRFIAALIAALCICPFRTTDAGPLEDFREAQKLYAFAAASQAAYSDYWGQITLNYLADNGWHVEKHRQVGDKADARLLLIHKYIPEVGKNLYMLAATGTENKKDVLTDLMVSKVYFAGHTAAEILENAKLKEVPPEKPMVHSGFYNYVKTAFTIEDPEMTAGTKSLLFNTVAANPEQKIYLVGHSLGGAAATLSAAALINLGANPNQLEVVTFGAPAVGNEGFRDEFESKLNLTRYVIYGDKVTGVLQGLGSYVQFGKAETIHAPKGYHYDSHAMTLYLDYAIKNYYHKRQAAAAAGVVTVPTQVLSPGSQSPAVYISPVVLYLPEALQEESYYLREALYDEYREIFSSYRFGDSTTFGDPLRDAAAAGCQWLVVPEVRAKRIKNETNGYRFTFQQTVYRVQDRQLVSLETYTSGSQKFTPIAAGLHTFLEMRSAKAPWLKEN